MTHCFNPVTPGFPLRILKAVMPSKSESRVSLDARRRRAVLLATAASAIDDERKNIADYDRDFIFFVRSQEREFSWAFSAWICVAQCGKLPA